METKTDLPEVLVSIDIEATGRIPGPYSMISLGAVAFSENGEEISRFKVNLEELPGSTREEYVMNWWHKQSPEAWKAATEGAIDATLAMHQFAGWLDSLPGRPKLIGWPLMTDFMFVYWYYMEFLKEEPPFGYDGIDIKTAAAITLGVRYSEISRTMVRERFGIVGREFTHDALDDALQQAELFFALRGRYTELRELQYLKMGVSAFGILAFILGAALLLLDLTGLGAAYYAPFSSIGLFRSSLLSACGIFLFVMGWRGWFLKPKRK